MVQIIPQSDFGSSFGQGLGQGLSEQIPKEANRYRLSEGLKSLGQQNLQGSNPFDLLSKLSSVPGMTPEMMQYALPLLQQQMQRQASIQHGQGGQGQQLTTQAEPIKGFERGGSNYLIPLNPEQINQKIAQYA